jgi:hypothetical protein
MKSKEELKSEYITSHTKNWDEETKEKYMYELEEDFRIWYEGYTQYQEDMKEKLYEFGKLVLDTFHSEGRTHSGNERLPRVKFDEWFNELNKQD